MSPHLCIATKDQRSRVSSRWWSTGSIGTLTQLPRHARRYFFSNTCQKIRGGKHVKVKKRRRQDILRLHAFRVHRNPLDHLSVNRFSVKYRFLFPILRFFTVKSPSVTQRSISQENAFKKSKNRSPFLRKSIGSNNSFN